MPLVRRFRLSPAWLVWLPLAVSGCGGGSGEGHHHPPPPPPPIAFDAAYAMLADDRLDSALDAARLDVATADFRIDLAPAHGLLFVDEVSGSFSYFPDDGFVGSDDFFWDCADAFGVSNVARVTIDVSPWGVASMRTGGPDNELICRR